MQQYCKNIKILLNGTINHENGENPSRFINSRSIVTLPGFGIYLVREILEPTHNFFSDDTSINTVASLAT
jgi:hypothetical protein